MKPGALRRLEPMKYNMNMLIFSQGPGTQISGSSFSYQKPFRTIPMIVFGAWNPFGVALIAYGVERRFVAP